MNFHNFFSIYVFEVKESIADIPKGVSRVSRVVVVWQSDCLL